LEETMDPRSSAYRRFGMLKLKSAPTSEVVSNRIARSIKTQYFAPLSSLALRFARFAVRKQLHAEEARGGRGAVEIDDEPVLEALSRRRKSEAKAVYFLARNGGEILGQRCVLLKHFEPRHADNSGCHGQAERIAQQGIHASLAGTAT